MPDTDSTSPQAAPPPPATVSRWTWLLPAITFVVGVALAGVVFAVTGSGDGDGAVSDARASASPAAPTTAPSSAGLVVTVPQSCLDAADGVTRTSQEVRGAVDAVRDLDARRLQEIVDRIQALQPQVQALANTCRATAGTRLQDGTLATAAPAPSPTK